MPYSYHYDEKNDVLYEMASGVISEMEFLESFRNSRQIPGVHPGTNTLADYSEVENPATFDLIQEARDLMQIYGRVIGAAKWAVVVPDMIFQGMAELFLIATKDLPVEIKLFHDVPSAEEWLGIGKE